MNDLQQLLIFVLCAGLFAALSAAVVIATLRHFRLSWVWLLFGFVIPLLLLPLTTYGAIAGFLFLVGTTATAGRWHFHEKTVGGDIRDRAEARITPRSVFQDRLARKPLTDNTLVEDGALIVGTDPQQLPVRIAFNTTDEGVHLLVVGKTGSGKTVTQAYIATQGILAGQGAVVVDPKGDQAMRDALRTAAAAAGKRYVEWTTSGPTVYNPYKHGVATEIADKALAAENYTEPHYLRQAQRYLGHQIRAMKKAKVTINATTMVEYMYPKKLATLAHSLAPADADKLRDYVNSLSTRQREELGGTRDRLAILAESDIGRWLTPEEGDTEFDLRDVVARGDVAYIQLDSDRFMEASKMIGVSIVCDLITIAASLQRVGQRRPTLVMIDEFAAVAATEVVRLFGRGRSAGLSLVVGTQSLSDFKAADDTDTLVDQVLDNISSLIVHQQTVPESAERLSQIAGTEETWTTTMRTHAVVGSMPTGDGTKTRNRQFIIHPDAIKSLRVGEAIVVALSLKQRPTATAMFMASRALDAGGRSELKAA